MIKKSLPIFALCTQAALGQKTYLQCGKLINGFSNVNEKYYRYPSLNL
jgi:hypothetical protein